MGSIPDPGLGEIRVGQEHGWVQDWYEWILKMKDDPDLELPTPVVVDHRTEFHLEEITRLRGEVDVLMAALFAACDDAWPDPDHVSMKYIAEAQAAVASDG